MDLNISTPYSEIKHPKTLCRKIVRDINAAQYIAWRIFLRDINARYRQTAFGYFWAVIPSLAIAIALSLAAGARVLQLGQTSIPYFAYVVFGVVLWQTFVESATGPIQAVAESRSMLAKINFPREALLMAKAGEVLINLFVKLVFLLLVFIWNKVPIHETVIFAIIPLFGLIAFGFAIGTLLAPIGIVFEDAPRGLAVVLSFWFLITPAAYPLPTEGMFATIVRWNPITSFIETIRDLTHFGSFDMFNYFLGWFGFCIVFFVFVLFLYRITMLYVIERIGSQ